MAGVNYDQFAGLSRLAATASTIDQRAAVILTYHSAIEREIDHVLADTLPRADRLKRFGYGHKVDVLGAAWKGSPEAGDKLYDVLVKFNDLRNAVAHGDRADMVDQVLGRLIAAYRDMVADSDNHIEIDSMAAGIIGFMADGPSPNELGKMFGSLDDLVNRIIPNMFGPDFGKK